MLADATETDNTTTGAALIRLPANHQQLGYYPIAGGFFFNPFLSNNSACWDAATTCPSIEAGTGGAGPAAGDYAAWSYLQANSATATPVTFFNNREPAGTPGNVSLWIPNGNNGFTRIQQQQSGGCLQGTLIALQMVTEKYDADLVIYNGAVQTYNDAVTAYNAAIQARNDGTAASDATIPAVSNIPSGAVSDIVSVALKYNINDLKTGNTAIYAAADQETALQTA